MATAALKPKAKASRKTLGIRATAEQSRILSEAARQEHRSVNSFVLQAAMNAAEGLSCNSPRKSPEEMMAIFARARAQVSRAIPANRDILEEFLEERRAEAGREELA